MAKNAQVGLRPFSSFSNPRSIFMNKLKLSAWEQVSLWAMVAVCLLPLVPYALNGLTS